jgi:mannose-6-phosphate isomerase
VIGTVILSPSRLEPVFSPRPWGALSLAPFFPEKHDLAEPIGEAWLTGSECTFATGPFSGRKLGETWPKMPVEWAGTAVKRERDFPLLVKFIFPEDKLSVQVHPGDDFAAMHEQAAGGCGKTEMWYAVRARPGAEVLVGLKPHVTRGDFEQAIAGGTAEDCLAHIPMNAGDTIFVPAGTAHTIGPGLLLCEIQQHSDLTYRVFDYNRPDAHGKLRPLHIEKALQVMRFGAQPGGKVDPVSVKQGALTETYLAACPYFATEKWESSERIDAGTSREHFDLLIFLEGHGNIRHGAEVTPYRPTQVWLMAAALGEYQLLPEAHTSVLRTYVPADPNEFTARMAARGVQPEAIARLIHA